METWTSEPAADLCQVLLPCLACLHTGSCQQPVEWCIRPMRKERHGQACVNYRLTRVVVVPSSQLRHHDPECRGVNTCMVCFTPAWLTCQLFAAVRWCKHMEACAWYNSKWIMPSVKRMCAYKVAGCLWTAGHMLHACGAINCQDTVLCVEELRAGSLPCQLL